MEITLEHDAFRVRPLVVRSASFWKGPRLFQGGTEIKCHKRKYAVRDDAGQERSVAFRGAFLDPVPAVLIDSGPAIHLVRPLKWYEWLWMGFPICLVFAGGALGGLLGVCAVWMNTRIFRGERSVASKYLLSGAISAVAVIAFLVLAIAMQVAVDPG